ncbi:MULTISPECIES: translesion DNA synthesis-associated protein ImuA [unclassified Cupriavidus]|uniref:translesion DNA synthesis-associated protein ImuA n=1 Tax=unclassified Cupriavidus TaxID=2640874 RepID=UPI00136575EA|nr:translesion DNA synthesis-associated protein ImuA [Cupriavidus sp. SW-Y-13]MWL90151.1 translesion DNA synthesis-associated protein ImuA [Cupriavidus sp. SW-Y-13]
MAAPLQEQPSLLAADPVPPSSSVHRQSVRELEHRYPGLWRAGQLGHAGRLPVCPTGYDALTAELPGGGWPAGAVTELLLAQEGAGELRLLMPALRTLAESGRRIGFVNPPYLPNAAGLASGLAEGLPARHLYWVRPTTGATMAAQRTDMLWAAEQMLRSQAFGALLVWLAGARPEALRRLQVLAQAGDTVVWVLRPMRVLHESSPAVLRLALSPQPGNLMSIVFHKRRGPVRDTPLLLPLEGMAHVPQRTGLPAVVPAPAVPSVVPSHVVADDVLDRGASAAPAAGRAAAELA